MIGVTSPATRSLVEGLFPQTTRTSRRSEERQDQDRQEARRLEEEQQRQAAATADGQDAGAKGQESAADGPAAGELTPDEQRLLRELQARDREVRAHEAAHKAAGGGLAGGASFTYQQGPDGRYYATGGEVSIDIGSERDPAATIAKIRAPDPLIGSR
jgi:hypothetical protein